MANEYKIAWVQNRLGLGQPLIDEQHQRLIELANAVLEGMLTGKPPQDMAQAVGRLLQYARSHFEFEESLMSRYGFPDRKRHAADHRRQLDQLQGMLDGLDQSSPATLEYVAAFLHDWVELHIRSEDRELASYLKNRDQKPE